MKTEAEALHERLLANAVPEPNSGCLLWLGEVNKDGWGLNHSRLYSTPFVHRQVILSAGEWLPSWLTVDHTCRVRCCINRAHLDIVSRETNSRRVHRR
jgi:hypothetical protein